MRASLRIRAWRSKKQTLARSIKRLTKKLEPFIDNHFDGRIYTQKTQADLNRLETLKLRLEALKNNRPEPKIKRVKIQRREVYTEYKLIEMFDKLTKDQKIEILTRSLKKATINSQLRIYNTMGFRKIKIGWVKK